MKHSILIIVVVAIVTALLRILPFLIFTGKKTPAFIVYLGKVLPFAIIGMLVVYCLKGVSVIQYPFGLPELIAGGIVALIHIWKKNTLISVAVGTVSYMLLIQFIFI